MRERERHNTHPNFSFIGFILKTLFVDTKNKKLKKCSVLLFGGLRLLLK